MEINLVIYNSGKMSTITQLYNHNEEIQTWNVLSHRLSPGGGHDLETCIFLGVA